VAYGREAYLAYLRSQAWRQLKLRYMASKLPKCCYVCKAPWRDDFVFHHRTYKNLGRARLMDIGPMCRDCHDALHWGMRLRRKQHQAAGRKASAMFDLWKASKPSNVKRMKERRNALRSAS
jgi:hypothetical protein